MNAKQLNPASLAFVGDAVYGLLVRERLSEISRPSGELHRLSVHFVCAQAQAKAYRLIEPLLCTGEADIFRRGRNFHTNTTPKNATVQEYHIATGLEVLFGFLHMSGNTERRDALFTVIWNELSKEI